MFSSELVKIWQQFATICYFTNILIYFFPPNTNIHVRPFEKLIKIQISFGVVMAVESSAIHRVSQMSSWCGETVGASRVSSPVWPRAFRGLVLPNDVPLNQTTSHYLKICVGHTRVQHTEKTSLNI